MAICGDVINGGVPAAPPPDVLNGGTPSTVDADTINGGRPLSVCPPFNDTSPAGYSGLLGDGGVGHSVLVHDVHGVPIVELSCRDVDAIGWSRELSEVSHCDLTVGGVAAEDVLNKVRYWVHHVTVYRDDEFVWTGVVQRISGDFDTAKITARDYGCYAWRTLTPVSKTWSNTDPTLIAAELWAAVYQWHVLPGAEPTVFPSSVAYDVAAAKDRQRTDQTLSDLVKLGVEWTIYRGRVVVMPTVRSRELVTPIMLADCDFAERMSIVRDGARFYTDITVRGKNFTANATRDVAGLRLQDIVNLDDLFGAQNVRTAAEQLVSRRATNQLQVVVPSGATLRPDAPITINRLMPGVIVPVFTTLAGGVTVERRLEKVEVSQGPGGERVAVTLGPIPGSADADDSSPGI